LSEEFHFELPIKVRFRDVDAFGHVNNAVYFTYMEQARIGYMRAAGLVPKNYGDTWLIIAEATCQFKAPSPFGASLVVKVRVPELRRSSFLMEYRIEECSTRRVMAVGRTVNVAYDYAAGKSRPIPPDWRAKIEQLGGNSPLIDGSCPAQKGVPHDELFR
jgi:acyl-CoA thioester hydrolase